ncbi:MAG: anti-sigma F factor [Eubacteriales bacterium]|nr:anti-sigma F factor [Eubacteriales bacterium]
MNNEMTLAFDSISENEGFARVAVAAFVTQLDPTLEEVADIKTAVSEAVTNAIIHGYPEGVHTVVIRSRLTDSVVEIWVTDEGVGIENVRRAMEPLYTSRPEQERSGLGFLFMEAFMDEVHVESSPGMGTTVYLRKQIGRREG